ncbi:helix-turn-helix domain [Holotrichia oblita]|uniref:Helix-turn-helix domain n=1 Tax=Holotrichia oblita TaxID=644536 RepID=A0ACB9T1K9_HOLOL|nr:helix-turn-helix domain [Holotrichia oblita]
MVRNCSTFGPLDHLDEENFTSDSDGPIGPLCYSKNCRSREKDKKRRFLFDTSTETQEFDEDQLFIDDNGNNNVSEVEAIIKQVSKEIPSSYLFEEDKERTKQQFLNYFDNLKSPSKLGIMKKAIALISPILTAAQLKMDMIMCYGEARSNSYEAQRIYRERYPLRQVPNVRTFIDVHRRLREDGCFRKPKLNSGVSRTRRTVRNEEPVLRMVENNPRTSTRKTSSATGLQPSKYAITYLQKLLKLWSCGETSLSMVPSKTKVIGGRGAVCSRVTSGTAKGDVTILSTVSVAEVEVPPPINFKGKYVWDQWMATALAAIDVTENENANSLEAEPSNASSEDLPLDTIKQHATSGPKKKRRVAPGTEVITLQEDSERVAEAESTKREKLQEKEET